MKNKSPLVTVLMPVYNGEKYLQPAIESILNQTFKDFEFLIINDGSTDNSENIILSFKDARIRYVKNEKNRQLIHTLNKGLQLSKGTFIARMDADDISLPQRLEKQIEILQNNKDIGVCGSWVKTIGINGGQIFKYPIQQEAIEKILFFCCEMCHPVSIFRKSLIDQYGIKYRPDYYFIEDWKFWLELGKVTHFYNIPEVLFHYRMHETNITKTGLKQLIAGTLKVRKENFNNIDLKIPNDLMIHFNNAMEYQLEEKLETIWELEKLLNKIITTYSNLCDAYVLEKLQKVWMVSIWKCKTSWVRKLFHLLSVKEPFNLWGSAKLFLKLAGRGYLPILKRGEKLMLDF